MEFWIELLGTIAFSVSGAMVAIERKMDLFGVLVLGLITSMGGGLMRDVVLGNVPPNMFNNPIMVRAGLLAAVYTYIVVCKKLHFIPWLKDNVFQDVLNFSDAIGLGLFTITGVNVANDAGYGSCHMMVIFLGMLTGVGGGMLRDIFAGISPMILHKHIYACASIFGAVVYMLLLTRTSKEIAMILGIALITMIRILAYYYKWNLPKAIA